MTSRRFNLLPFSGDPHSPELRISGTITRQDNRLAIAYLLAGELGTVVVPSLADCAERRGRLWEATCFEFFLAIGDAGMYWEGNLSPAGHWNLYRFNNYRQDMQEEAAFASLPVKVSHEQNGLCLDLEIDLSNMITTAQPLRAGISTVIKSMDGSLSYWALIHPGDRPDFHRADSFIITI